MIFLLISTRTVPFENIFENKNQILIFDSHFNPDAVTENDWAKSEVKFKVIEFFKNTTKRISMIFLITGYQS